MKSNTVYTAYVPHGINSKKYKPIDQSSPEYEAFLVFKENFSKKCPHDFLVFWTNRNARRKQPGDVILAFKEFTRLVKEYAPDKKVALLMHTQIKDENGTDLEAVVDNLASECTIVFSEQSVSIEQMNFYYNLADVTLNIASNEGFGLSSAESIMAGTMVINNVTGGLQDQCRFEDENGNWINFDSEFTSNHTGRYRKCGPWALPVFPAVRSLQGSIPTPYIFDDRCRFEDVALQLLTCFKMTKEERSQAAKLGREWMLSEESGMSAKVMSDKFVQHINHIIENWTPAEKFTFGKVQDKDSNRVKSIGITPDYLNITTIK